MKNLIDGIMLDSFKVFVPYSHTKPMVEALFEQHSIPIDVTMKDEGYLYVQSKVLDTAISCKIEFVFKEGRMGGAGFTPADNIGHERRIYNVLQARLEMALGKRGKAPLLQQVFGASDSYIYHKWEMPHMLVEHTLLDRFGAYDMTYITLYDMQKQ